ncbi:porin family protein [Pedobacter nototheniae]|uniref:porin family protein n=1 Tax=Pedobacter nototheniae TaxID=2488994 RepID=UPI002931ABE6|nr:porin family protein [Pedobacter nototheniae]
MKKLTLSLLMVAGLGLAASAQTSPVKFGVKAGVTFPSLTTSGSDAGGETAFNKSTTSFYVGGTVDIPVSEMFSVQPGLSLIGKGGKESNLAGTTLSAKINTMYIEIPVNAVVSFKTGDAGKVFIGAGPYYAMAISGKLKVGDQSADIKFGKSEDNLGEDDLGLRRGDFGVNFLGGFQLNNGLNIHAGYGLGLSNILPEGNGNVKLKNSVISVGVGFSF